MIQTLKTCEKVPGTRSYHKFVSQNASTVRCYILSKSDTYSDYRISGLPYFETISFRENEIVVCVYESWWIGKDKTTVLKTLTFSFISSIRIVLILHLKFLKLIEFGYQSQRF